MKRDREEQNRVDKNGTGREDRNWLEEWSRTEMVGTRQRGRNEMAQDGTGWFITARNGTDRVGTGPIGMERNREERNGAEKTRTGWKDGTGQRRAERGQMNGMERDGKGR